MTAHTPGPWTVATPRSLLSGSHLVCSVVDRDVYTVGDTGPTGYGPAQRDADARLIAAAPDLLDALDALLVAGRALQTDASYNEAADRACAAIRKAEVKP